MSSVQFTAADRDETGKIAVEPRSIADLLPGQGKQEAAPAPIPREMLIAAVALVLLAIVLMAVFFNRAPAPTAPVPIAPTRAPTAAPTAAPTPLPALLGYFDYRDPSSTAPLSAGQIARVIARAGDDWRQVSLNNSAATPWLRAADVPAGVAVADNLPDLAPRPTAQPVSAPVPVLCAQDNAPYVVTTQVQSAAGAVIGSVMRFSCTSQADAQTKADAAVAAMRAAFTPPPTPTGVR